jgi:tRNA-Thr(GGU) m(6)t(6)A37 methyltransferase TsaA
MTRRPASGIRPGETALDFDPGARADAGVTFIGVIRSPWRHGDCPRNLREARERGGGGTVWLGPEYRAGIADLAAGQRVLLLYWMDGARRDLVVQRPSHGEPRSVFSLRSPARPNPIAVAAVTVTAIDPAAGTLGIDAIDCYDETPLLDIKPWLASVDVPPDAAVPDAAPP